MEDTLLAQEKGIGKKVIVSTKGKTIKTLFERLIDIIKLLLIHLLGVNSIVACVQKLFVQCRITLK